MFLIFGSRQVLIKSSVGLCDELAIKSLLPAARLISRDQKYRIAFRVECEGDAPDAVCGVKAQLLHIRVARTLEGIDARPAKLRAKLLQQQGMSAQLTLHVIGQRVEFRIEVLVELNFPGHSSQHVIQIICCKEHTVGEYPAGSLLLQCAIISR